MTGDNSIKVDVSTPSTEEVKKEEERLSKYVQWLDKYDIQEKEAIRICEEKTGVKNLTVGIQGFADSMLKLDTGENISERWFYLIHIDGDMKSKDYLLDKENGKVYVQVEQDKYVYTLVK